MPVDIHFLNVGHGDCTIVEHPSGRLTMIDINNSMSLPTDDVVAMAEAFRLNIGEFVEKRIGGSYQSRFEDLLVDPVDYLKERWPGHSLFRYVQTHPDMDHMSGLHRITQEGIPILNMWDLDHTKVADMVDWSDRYDYSDWQTYQDLRERTSDPKVLHLLREVTGEFYTEDGLTILSPTTELVDYCNDAESWNNASYVIRLDHAGRRVILPGDAEDRSWSDIVDHFDKDELAGDVLKAAHHGRESGFHQEAVELMGPEVVICSVGKKPETDASDEYASLGAEVLSTRYQGTMRLRIRDDGDMWLYNHKGELITQL